ncbi:hypothetical protein [Paraburkholderia tropica]|uniref:hypothetical protein n=1 Tax=Paraburkholderia tropica TaxID=92647 RepID=UPI000AACEC8B|nr:hypothetical protein [Paraburkholderia tropica]
MAILLHGLIFSRPQLCDRLSGDGGALPALMLRAVAHMAGGIFGRLENFTSGM